MLKGKKLSILGDSISTYKGVSNDASANATIQNNPYFYKEPFPEEKTYYRRVIDYFGLELCVNNSWSGGNLSGTGDETSGVRRASELSKDDGTSPDIIIVFMGINDLGRRVDPAIFSRDYEKTLMTIKDKYPKASVFCVNIPERDISINKQTLAFNIIIDDAVRRAGSGIYLADLFESPMRGDRYYMNTLDGLHPDEDGMKMIADVICSAIISKLEFGSVALKGDELSKIR